MPKYKLMVARFPYMHHEDDRCVDWLLDWSIRLSRDSRFELTFGKLADTPITMTRNAMIAQAQRSGADVLLMVDSDMAPDCELRADPAAKAFLPSSLDFLLNHPGPCIVGAPYCGPPPDENVYVFTWADHETGTPNCDVELKQYTREHAAMMAGITEVAALPTGLILIDMRAFEGIKPPFTYYEWKDEGPPCDHCGARARGPEAEKSSTEDVTLTRDLSLAGVKMYCNWDAWAGHVKLKIVRKPRPWTADVVAERIRPAIVSGVSSRDSIREVKGDRFAAEIAAAEAAFQAAPRFRPSAASAAPIVGTTGPTSRVVAGAAAGVAQTTAPKSPPVELLPDLEIYP